MNTSRDQQLELAATALDRVAMANSAEQALTCVAEAEARMQLAGKLTCCDVVTLPTEPDPGDPSQAQFAEVGATLAREVTLARQVGRVRQLAWGVRTDPLASASTLRFAAEILACCDPRPEQVAS